MEKDLRINPDRFKANFDALAQIGATVEGGVHRPTFNPAHLQSRDWFHQQAQNAGLDFQIDRAGNHSAILDCGPENGKTFLLGSHLDSVLNGGRFDGALGVVAALEVLLSVRDASLSLPFHLEAIDFTDEEGTLVGLLGSSALTGKLKPEDLVEPRGGRETLLTGLMQTGLTEEGLLEAQRDPSSLTGYLELHIEQGGNLIEAQADAGVVTGIVGIVSYRLTFIGNANHAGTTSMKSRRDASQGASTFTLKARELVIEKFPDCVVNVGNMNYEPGAFNIIPGRVTASLEFRSPKEKALERLETSLLEIAHLAAERFNLGLEIEFLGKHLPAPMNIDIQDAILKAAQILGLASIPLASGAGHDAQSLASICPVGMIFVPSVGGISHSPEEFTHWQDCVNGANLLLQTVLELAIIP
jgi:beta-ureidopropionase / N-carbamoyl-L-amino-acid hydrolase